LIDRHDDLVANVFREDLETEIAAHGLAHICLPISSAVG
jgi:hypothetical protein